MKDRKKLTLVNESRIARQKTILLAGLLVLVITMALLFFIYRNYRLKQKTNVELLKAKNRAEQSEKFKQLFLANMSHEIRTPMNVVMGMTELVLDTPLDPKQKNYLTGIRRASANLLHVINDILDVSKMEAGKIELEHIDFSIRDVVLQVNELLQHKAAEKGIQLFSHVDPLVPEIVKGDPSRLNQVLLNLGGNAIKFTEHGSVTINVSREINKDTMLFSVKDTGIGIPKEKQEQIFESFRQAHSTDSRRYGGTGLGLTISRQLIELMDGILKVESEEGRGSHFSFAIPLHTGSLSQSNRLYSNDPVDPALLDGLRILLADDHDDNRIVAVDTLQSKFHVEISEAVNGQQVLQILQKEDFDIILMDVQMPLMDGYETTKQIRLTFPSPKNNIPIIALTASVIRSDLDKCRAAGMNDYVPKPFQPGELFLAIAKATGRNVESPNYSKNHQNVTDHSRLQENRSVTDLSYLEDFCNGDQERMRKYITIFLNSTPILFEKLNLAVSTDNYKAISTLLHNHKTNLVMMGMKDASELILEVELACRTDSPDHKIIISHIEEINDQLKKATFELASY
jgi:signal transduction histidine kinase/CheY-like chemotaxis protein/HPt (histidine-containing phosphotransfer) domain-containing protein